VAIPLSIPSAVFYKSQYTEVITSSHIVDGVDAIDDRVVMCRESA